MRTNCWWRLSGYVMRHRRDLLLGFGAALAGTVIAVLVPLVTKRVIDDAIAADHRPLAPWAVVLVAAAGATYLLTYVRRYYGGRIAHLVQHDLRMDAFQALLRWDGRQQDRWSSGQLIVRTTNDLQLVQALLFDVPNVLRHVLTLLLGVAVMTWLSVPLALLAVLLVPVIGLIAHRSRRLLAAATHCAQEHKAAVTGVVDAAVCGIRVVKAFGQEERETVKLVTASRALYAAQLRVARLNAHFGPLLQTLPALGQMAVFALGGWMAAQGSITVGTFVAFWACLTLLARPACDLAGMLTIAQQARAGAVRVLELIDSRPTLVDGTKPLSPEARLSLEFQRVSFGYVADRPVLREISLSVRAGETLAVVGAPGSGKSTLASLATRCYDVTQGAVRIGGQDVRELTLDSLRSAIGLVPEDAVLFSGTIGANIAYGRPDATPEQIATAARAAHIEEFVNTLPDGYQTAVGARGLTLSGGQRQRIALARALLHQPRLLIMTTRPLPWMRSSNAEFRRCCGRRSRIAPRSFSPAADPCLPWPTGSRSSTPGACSMSAPPTRCGSAVPAIGNCCRPRRISPMTWLSRSARRCVDRWPGSAPRPRSTPTSTTPGLTITHPAPTRYAACCVSSAARLR